MSSILVASSKPFQLTCSHSSLLLQVGKNGSLSCQVRDVTPSFNSTFNVNVTSFHGSQFEGPVIQVVDSLFNNKTKVVNIFFPNVTWLAAGDYSLEVKFQNVTRRTMFTLKVYGNDHFCALCIILIFFRSLC